MKYQIITKVDMNDADYNMSVEEIDEDDLKIVRDVMKRVKAFKPYKAMTSDEPYSPAMPWTHDCNWPEGQCQREDLGEKTPKELYNLTEEEEDVMMDYLPWCEEGFHDIISVKISPLSDSEELL